MGNNVAVVVKMIKCEIPSSGVSDSMPVFTATVSMMAGAIAAAAGVAAGAGVAVGTGGAATPLAVLIPGAMALSAAAMTEAVLSLGGAIATGIGHSQPDQVYLTVNGKKVFPKSELSVDMCGGDVLESRPETAAGSFKFGPHTLLLRGVEQVWAQDSPICKEIVSRDNPIKIELWDRDLVTADDRLGYIDVDPAPVNLNQLKIVSLINEQESSVYFISYMAAPAG